MGVAVAGLCCCSNTTPRLAVNHATSTVEGLKNVGRPLLPWATSYQQQILTRDPDTGLPVWLPHRLDLHWGQMRLRFIFRCSTGYKAQTQHVCLSLFTHNKRSHLQLHTFRKREKTAGTAPFTTYSLHCLWWRIQMAYCHSIQTAVTHQYY